MNRILPAILVAILAASPISFAETLFIKTGGDFSGSPELVRFEARLKQRQIPKTYLEAAGMLMTVVRNMEPSFIEKAKIELADSIAHAWKLDDWNTPLARDLIYMGFVDSRTMALGMLGGASDLATSPAIDMTGLRRQLILSRLDDGITPVAPVGCGKYPDAKHGRSPASIAGFSRGVHWFQCEDGNTYLFLPERGYFESAEVLSDICDFPAGDIPPACKKRNASPAPH